MGVALYPHNQTAYDNAIRMMEECVGGRAAVVHPTGTGKSFIAFKLAEDNPDQEILWLAPSEYIFRSQTENYLEAGGDREALSHVKFYTYAKLLYSMGKIEELEPPAYIVLDEFHRCGAEGWGAGVDALLEKFPGAKVLGLSATHIRYLDSRRDMAQELFDGHIASRMDLGESLAKGILPVPLYVCGLYEYRTELDRITLRVMNQRGSSVRNKSAELLDKLRYSLQDAEGPREIFAKHMKKDGKYILFCTGRAHMEDMVKKAGDWFADLDAEPAVYRAIYDNEDSPEEVRNFQKDKSPHLKLLYCIDMLNEGIHVADVDGVVLLRPTASPTLYLQQIGRALSVPDKNAARQPIIFDLVDNFDGLKCIDSFLEQYRNARRQDGNAEADAGNSAEQATDDADGTEQALDSTAETGAKKRQYEFRIIDEARDSRELFEKLLDVLASSWEICFQEAEKYREIHGDLNIPKRYVTEDGIALGSWLLTQKRVRAGNVPGNLSKEQIDRLDALGMVWENRTGKAWEKGYQELFDFYGEHGHTDVPARFVTEDGFPLGKFVSNQRAARKNRNSRKLLPEREQRLNAIGFIWEKSEDTWTRYYAAAKTFYEREGHLNVPVKYVTEDGVHLGAWIQARSKERDTLPEDKRSALEEIGMAWGSRYDAKWDEKYRLAEHYFQEHGNLDVPKDYKTEGVNLGRWIATLRYTRENPQSSHYRLDEERIRQLDAIGMCWTGSLERCSTDSWEIRFLLAEQYYRKHGNLRVSQAYVEETRGMRIWLGKWLADQRRKYNSPEGRRILTEEQAKKLEGIGMEW